MPYRSHKTEYNPGYSEPSVEQSLSGMDIEDFILTKLIGRDKEVCEAFILSGDSVAKIAAAHNLSRLQVRTILRKALEPLARDFGIRTEHK